MNPKIIEFVSIGGTGKSTLEAEITTMLKSEDFKVENFSKLKPNIYLKSTAAIKSFYYLSKFSKKNIESFIENMKILTVYFSKIKLALKLEGTVLIDEGSFHKSMVLSRQSNNYSYERIIELLKDEISYPDYIIILKAEPKVIFKRRKLRGRKDDMFTYEDICLEANDFNKIIISIEKIIFNNNLDTDIIVVDYGEDETPYKCAKKIKSRILNKY